MVVVKSVSGHSCEPQHLAKWADSVEKQRVADAESGALNGARAPL